MTRDLTTSANAQSAGSALQPIRITQRRDTLKTKNLVELNLLKNQQNLRPKDHFNPDPEIKSQNSSCSDIFLNHNKTTPDFDLSEISPSTKCRNYSTNSAISGQSHSHSHIHSHDHSKRFRYYTEADTTKLKMSQLYNSSIPDPNDPEEIKLRQRLVNDPHERRYFGNKITINVSGAKHQVMFKTLAKFPVSRLGLLQEYLNRGKVLCPIPGVLRKQMGSAENSIHHGKGSLVDDYNPEKHEVFFNRHAGCFTAILNFYRTGKLHMPSNICLSIFKEELTYWGIDSTLIEPCCYCRTQTKDEKVLNNAKTMEIDEGEDQLEDQFSNACLGGLRRQIWDLFEVPESSGCARLVLFISVVFILLSTISMVFSTMSSFSQYHERLGKIEMFCIVWFSFEYLIRLLVHPQKCAFITELMNVIDLLSILPFYIGLAIDVGDRDENGNGNLLGLPGTDMMGLQLHVLELKTYSRNSSRAAKSLMDSGHHIYNNQSDSYEEIQQHIDTHSTTDGLMMLRRIITCVRVVKIVRVLKLARHSTGLQSLGYTLTKSVNELSLLFLSLLLTILIYGSCIYYIEIRSPEGQHFSNVYEAFWCVTITITTVGYGDMYPKTAAGQVIGCLCSITGVIIIALPIPIIVQKFSEFYDSRKAVNKNKKRYRQSVIVRSSVMKSKK